MQSTTTRRKCGLGYEIVKMADKCQLCVGEKQLLRSGNIVRVGPTVLSDGIV